LQVRAERSHQEIPFLPEPLYRDRNLLASNLEKNERGATIPWSIRWQGRGESE